MEGSVLRTDGTGSPGALIAVTSRVTVTSEGAADGMVEAEFISISECHTEGQSGLIAVAVAGRVAGKRDMHDCSGRAES